MEPGKGPKSMSFPVKMTGLNIQKRPL